MVNMLMLIRGGLDRLRRRIKIVKADGTAMKLRSPVSVKEILIDYPNHGIFEPAAFGGVGICSLPLPERAGLVAGHLYYLIPLPLTQDGLINYNNNRKREPFARASSDHSIPRASSWLQPPSSAGTATDATRQREKADDAIDKIYTRGGVRIVSSSYSTHGSIVRVKLRLRREELTSFISANNLVHMENGIVPSLIQRATRQSALSPWKPSLDTITEPHSPHGDS